MEDCHDKLTLCCTVGCAVRALSFYRKYGFVEVGEHVFVLGSDPQRDLVLVRGL